MSVSEIGLMDRLRAHWRTKLCLGSALTAVFCAGYFALGHNPMRLPIRLDDTVIDRSVEFAPGWVWAYQSLYLLLPFAWLSETKDQLRRYAIGFAIVMLTGFGFFLLCPVAGPRPVATQGDLTHATPSDVMYGLLVRYDTPLNSMPSLHLALATYSACVAVKVTSGLLRRRLQVGLPIWVILIGYGALATKQHYWVDLPPGIALGWLAQLIAWRHSGKTEQATNDK